MSLNETILLQVLGRTLRVDHVENYKQPKEFGDEDDITKQMRSEGCAPQLPQSDNSEKEEDSFVVPMKKVKKGIDKNMCPQWTLKSWSKPYLDI